MEMSSSRQRGVVRKMPYPCLKLIIRKKPKAYDLVQGQAYMPNFLYVLLEANRPNLLIETENCNALQTFHEVSLSLCLDLYAGIQYKWNFRRRMVCATI